jgi:tetratricopeptide (TPR) repeat protein
MNPVFTAWKTALNERRYKTVLANLPAMVRAAETPEEVLLAARTASLAMLPGLEHRLLRRANRSADCPPVGRLAMAGLLVSGGRYLEAEELINPYLEDPAWTTADRAGALALLAVSLGGRRRFRSADQALDRAEALVREADPAEEAGRDVRIDLDFARLSLRYFADRWEEAEAGLAAHVSAGVNQSRFFLLLAQCREHLGRPAEALEVLQEGCRRLPEHPLLWATAASAAWALDQVDLALEMMGRCEALLPHARGRRMAAKFRRWCASTPVRLPVPAVRQAHNHCFPACLAMVMGYWGRPTDHRRLGQAIMDSDRGTPLFRALHHLEAEGWVVRTFRATPERVKALIDAGVPAILGLEFAGGAHVHICIGYDSETLLLQDPVSIRPRRVRLAHFQNAYAHSDYWALAFAPADRTGALESLPEGDDRQIRLMQRCWEALHDGNLEEARTAYVALEAEPLSVGRQLFRVRIWPQLGSQRAALKAVAALLEAFPTHREIRLELARHLERLGKVDQAVALAEEASSRWSGAALMIRARATRQKSLTVAARLFRQASIADPQSAEPVADWGRCEADLGHFDRAEALAAAACEMDPNPGFAANLTNSLCIARLNQREWAGALQAAEAAMTRFPDDVRFPPMAAEALRKLGRSAEGRALLEERAEALPDNPSCQARLGRFLLLEGEPEEGIARMRRAAELAPEWDDPVDWVCSAASRMDKPELALLYLEELAKERPNLCWSLARLWLRHDPGRAVGWAETALVADGRTPEAQVEFGHIALSAGRDKEAKWAFEGAIEHSSSPLPRASHGLARIARKAEQPEEYREHMEHAIAAATNPEEIQRYADELAEQLEQEKNWQAVFPLLEGIKGRVDEAWRLTYVGYATEQTEGHALALPLYDAALELNPEQLWARYRRPLALIELGRKEEALAQAEESAAKWPNENGLLWVLGRCQHALGQDEAALQAYLRCYDLKPDWAPVRRSMWLVLGRAEWERVVGALGQLEARRQATLFEAFGGLWKEAGQILRARQAWDRATELAPDLAEPYIRLAESHLQDAKPALAWEATIPFLAHNPTEGVPFALWLAGRTPVTDVATALTRAIPQVGDAFRTLRADLWWQLGEAYIKLGRNDSVLEVWEKALADAPDHRGALWQACRHYDRWQRNDQLLALLAPLDEAGQFPADRPFMAVWFLRAAIRENRPRRPQWRRYITDRVAAMAREKEASPSEIEKLQELYERLELEFGNLRAAWHASIFSDELANWLRVLIRSLFLRLRKPPLEIRPGESAEPATRRALLPWDQSPSTAWAWVKRNPLTLALLIVLLIWGFVLEATHPYQPSPAVAARAPKDDGTSPLSFAAPLIAVATLITSRWITRRRS